MRVLAAVDGSRASVQAARYAAVIAAATHGSVVLARALPDVARGPRSRAPGPAADAVLDGVRAVVVSIGAPVTELLLPGPPAIAIPRELHARQYDLVTLGSRGLGESGVPSRFLGSTALQIVAHAEVPVLLVRATETGEPVGGEAVPLIRTLLVPTDGSLASLSGADVASRLAGALDADATLLHIRPARPRAPLPPEAEVFALSRAPFDRHRLRVHLLSLQGDPAREILRVARERHFDLIVMGTYGAGEPWHRRLRLGSVAETVLIGTPCPVVLTKQPAAAEV